MDAANSHALAERAMSSGRAAYLRGSDSCPFAKDRGLSAGRYWWWMGWYGAKLAKYYPGEAL